LLLQQWEVWHGLHVGLVGHNDLVIAQAGL
jgi:hypothetical protein